VLNLHNHHNLNALLVDNSSPKSKLSQLRWRTYSVTDLLASREQATDERLFLQHDKGPAYLRAAEVFTSYIAALPPENAAKEPNRWVIVLGIGKQTTITIELRS
jgi:hypothetical protein